MLPPFKTWNAASLHLQTRPEKGIAQQGWGKEPQDLLYKNKAKRQKEQRRLRVLTASRVLGPITSSWLK